MPAAGNNQTAKNTYTSYLAVHVYENNVLQFFNHEEGRIRPQRNSAGVATGVYYYDYFIKDHLGNTRMVLTDEKQIDAYPVASLEATTINSEKTYYDIPDASRIATSEVPGYPVTGASNAWVQRLNGNGQKTGTSIVLRVMSGDKVSISADSWYASGVTPGTPSNLSVADLIASLAGGIAGSGGASHSVAQIQQNPNLQSGLGSFLTNVVNADNAANGNLPKSYLNYVLFDEQLNVVITNDGKNSGIDRVGAGGALKSHQITQRPITRNGYLYIYVSNETPGLNVIFDNLKVTHVRGELTEETHYYPFGLTMAGISSKAAGKLQNKHKFNGGNELQSEEFSDGSGLELYDAVFRMYDPQIGRFRQIDRLGDISNDISLYTFGSDNPVLRNDPLGLMDTAVNQSNPRVIEGVTVKASNHRYQTMQWFGGALKTDTHLKGNLETFTYRVRSGEDLFQRGDRYSYVQDVLNRKLPEWYLRELDAEQFERDFYLIYFSLFTLPEDVAVIAGITSSGIKSLPALSRLLKEGKGIEVAAEVGSRALVKTGINLTEHAAERLAQRGITRGMVEAAINKGARFYDPKNKTINYILKNGFASGKDLLVGANPLSGNIATVIRGSKLVNSRFIPL